MQFMLQTASFGIYSVNFDILMYTVAVVVYWKQSVVLLAYFCQGVAHSQYYGYLCI